MRQVWIPRIGIPEVLEVREAPDPHPQKGQVRIAVEASGINFADIMARMGLYPDAPPLPAVVGYEVSGTIDELGEGVDGLKLGDRVLAFVRFGGYSDKVLVKAGQALALPENLSTVDAAGIPVNYLTAWIMMVTQGNLQPGQTVLVHSAGGGVGIAALQIAKWRGAKVIGTASAGKHPRLTEMGVAHCIDYRNQDFLAEVKKVTDGRGVDMVLDAVGGNSYRKSYRSLAPLGKLFMFGASSFATDKSRNILSVVKGMLRMPRFTPVDMMQKNRAVFGTNMGKLWDEEALLQSETKKILNFVEQGELNPVIDATFPFEKAPDAHHYIQNRKNFGKVLLTPE
jgi:NADPH:quinone reductase-like Zn-dependent oxidoreductase